MEVWRNVRKANFDCSSKCSFNEATLELFIGDDVDAKFARLQNYFSGIYRDSTVDSYPTQDKDAVTSVKTVDIRSIN